MTENYPPVPPAPQQPDNQPFVAPAQFQGQPPQYNQGLPAQYGQQPYPPQQPYGQPQYGQPHYAPYPPQQYASQWGQAPAKPKSSGFRIAAGIIGIVLGFFMLIEAGPGFGHNAFIALLLLIAALGNATAGILLLANQRGTTRGVPITAISFAGFALLSSLMAIAVPYYGGAPLLIDLLLATPVIVLLGIGLSRESRPV
ncbi:hypothetical protein [Pseudarthrobacter sp. NIBRBAC000502770]|uniref:hypothetical protein n=1 Tax=Pseudarthrobacter sp. NIBRBAC000502770 TaxID=2590785 RepID=UPI00113FF135|nr:hypothetical protein [Pseudarthrobacter sp. NIBRBAC000502770]QDG89074.1 hypothetical protein NIBR502770_11725 [Pseudarthrobacter sp. NIBRBAC000502770]